MSSPVQSSRIIGIRHRTKKTVEGEPKPTQLAINYGLSQDGQINIELLDLEDETAERDFVLGLFPVKWRAVETGENLTKFPEHHIKRRPAEKEEVLDGLPDRWVIKDKETGKVRVASKVPTEYDGLHSGDNVAMILGGSGDILAYALSRQAEKVDAKVLRVPPFILKDRRGDALKDEDATLLAKLAETEPSIFYEVRPRDRDLIMVREMLRQRNDAMKARIGCEQRLRQRAIGMAFMSDDLAPEGAVEKMFDAIKSSDAILTTLEKEESATERKLSAAVEKLDIYNNVLHTVTGCGPMIAPRLVSSIIDIRQFGSKASLKAFCGTFVRLDGTFPRRQVGKVSNWNPDARQALYLLGEQFNRRPGSTWGAKLLEYKEKMHVKYPAPVEVEITDKKGKTRKVKRYTPGHLHKMAMWKTLAKFVEWLWREWWKLEGREFPATLPAPAPESPPTASETKTESKPDDVAPSDNKPTGNQSVAEAA